MGAEKILVVGDDQQFALIEASLVTADRERLWRSPGYAKVLQCGFALCAVICDLFDSATLDQELLAMRRLGVPWPATQVMRPTETRSRTRATWAASAVHHNDCGLRLGTMLRRSVIDWTFAAAADATAVRFTAEHVLIAVLRAVCLADPPIKTVPELMAGTGFKHTALYDAWDASMQPVCDLTLGEFLDWVVLLRALGRKSPSRSWAAVAGRVGVQRKTLAAMSSRTYDCAIESLDAQGVGAEAVFVDRVLDKAGLAAVYPDAIPVGVRVAPLVRREP